MTQPRTGMSSLKSSTTTLNHPGGAGEVDDDAPPSGDDDAANKCVGETQIGFDTLRSWSNDNTNTTTNTTTTTTTSNIDESSDTGTLEGPPPPLPAKTYNLPNHLPPPPPTLLNQPLDLSAKTPTDSHIDQSWRFSKYNEPSLPPGLCHFYYYCFHTIFFLFFVVSFHNLKYVSLLLRQLLQQDLLQNHQ